MRILRSIGALALVLLCAISAPAADVASDAAKRLAAELAAKAGAGSGVSLTVENRSSMPEGQFSDFKRTLTAELWAKGLPAVDKSRAVADLQVTVSENVRGYLLVAQLREGQNQEVVMVPLARSTAAVEVQAGGMMVLRRTPVWTQDDPILDAALLQTGGASHLLVLDTKKITLYALGDAGGSVVSSQPIVLPLTWPRDMRGRLVLRRDHLFDAYLPGAMCSSASQAVQGTQCRASDDPWPLDAGEGTMSGFYAGARNYFPGTLSGTAARGQDVGPFYSAALLPNAAFFAGVDGSIRMFAGGNLSTLDLAWGSSVAAINSGCGSGWQVLATGPGDFSGADSVQAYDVSATDAAPISQKVEFSGPVTALWTSSDRASAVAISRNLKTGRYEAAILTIACSR